MEGVEKWAINWLEGVQEYSRTCFQDLDTAGVKLQRIILVQNIFTKLKVGFPKMEDIQMF